MRRTVATLLVVATALLMAVPVGASEEARPAGPAVLPAAPAVVQVPPRRCRPRWRWRRPLRRWSLRDAPAAVAPAAPPVARPAVQVAPGQGSPSARP